MAQAQPDGLVYRLAFGQPRQEDFLEYLHSPLGTDTAAEGLAEPQIRLEPKLQISIGCDVFTHPRR